MNYSNSHQTSRKKKGHGHKYQRKQLICPICKYRIIDEGINTSSALHVMEDDDQWEGDYYTKCHRCNAEVGVKKIE